MAVDLKYGQVTTEHGTIGEDEPVFIIRAQDASSLDSIMAYFRGAELFGAPNDFLENEDAVMDRFRDWQNANPDQVKVPD